MAERLAAGRAAAAVVGLASAALAGWLALHHPLSPPLALAGVVVLAAAQAAWPPLWLIALPALMPWLGFGAWSGWLVAEEMDLAVLAVAAGAWLRWAVRPDPLLRASRASRRARAWGRLPWWLWIASVLVALHLGVADAGGWRWSWWQGLREPLNALRLAKPTLAVLLLLPLWWRLQQQPGQRCADQLGLGMTLALAGITLWCVYERAAFPGLFNMSTDYRTTGPFWETFTGGAALDISLALTLPFALRLAWTARQPLAAGLAGAVVAGGVYAGLTTFSRIVYLALPVGAVLFWLLQRRQAHSAAAEGATPQAASKATQGGAVAVLALLATLVAGLGLWLFPHAGHRGLLALLGNTVLLLWLAPHSSRQSPLAWATALIGGLMLGGLLVLLAPQLPKGAYLVYGVATLATTAALVGSSTAPTLWPLAASSFVAQLIATVLVARHWGGSLALPAAATAVAALGLIWLLAALRARPPWPAGAATVVHGGVATLALLSLVAVFGGGDYMADRLSHTETDRADRWQHFHDGLALNRGGTSLWLGQGLGRYADLYGLFNRPESRPGDIRLVAGEQGQQMRMVAGNHVLGWGELLRLSQRVGPLPATGLKVQLELRADAQVRMVTAVCDKHLLYDSDCRLVALNSQPGQPGWQTLEQPLPDAGLPAGGPPRISVFSVASETRVPLELRRVAIIDANGQQWLANPDFAAGGARWFITSDRNHLPWHAKNLQVHLLVEQGLLGLFALSALTIAALAALLGPVRAHPLAPALAAAIVGVWVVGGVDSVLDMPRVATWLLLLTTMATHLFLPSRAQHGPSGGSPPATPNRPAP